MSDLDELIEEFAAFAPAEKKVGHTPREERIIAGFEDILRFVDEHGHAPRHGEGNDIFERLYAVRLDRIRAQPDCRDLVLGLDRHGLLAGAGEGVAEAGEAFTSDDDLMAEFSSFAGGEDDITTLKHVRSREEITAAEEIAHRQKCEDFDAYEPLFEAVRRDLKAGMRQSRPFREDAGIRQGEFFIVGGQIAYVAQVPQELTTEHGHAQGRLRVIYDNGTENDPLLRSFQRALYKPELDGRRISEPDAGPLFSGEVAEDDQASGSIYVLRSKSDNPTVAAHHDLIHKIGVTGMDVGKRIANARLDPTFLMADVEVVTTYKLFNINRTKLENVIHRVFGPAKLDIEIPDRFGNPVVPREWFMVPIFVIDEAVERIKDGTITDYIFDPATASLKRTA